MRHLILGAGPSGVTAAEAIRKAAPDDAIVIVGDEPEPPYSRMAIPYLLTGKVPESGTYLRRGDDHFSALGVELRRGRAAAVDAVQHTVTLEDGSVLPFDRLLIATGSSPATAPIPGIDGPNVHSCWTLPDARAIMARAQPGARVLQLGAGFIGCIILEALAARGVELTVVEMGDRMVPRMMGPAAGAMIERWVESKGVRVRTGVGVTAIDHPAPGTNGAMRVRLSNGETLEADLVISATGVRPNIGFLENSDVKCLLGVLTDEHLQTSVPGIYAAGDCAEAFDRLSGRTIVSAIQPNATEQARIAAQNMVGRKAALNLVTQINVLDTLGLISASFGNWQGVPDGDHVELTDEANWRHLSLQFDGPYLVGCNAVGWSSHVGVMRGLVEGQVRLTEHWKRKLHADPTLLMEAYLACTHSRHDHGPAARSTRPR
jgi:NADPH-dependent 2,4-dienoyl-CoA reductase/sulfur reductase-like enzyme